MKKGEVYVELSEVMEAFLNWMGSKDCFIINEEGKKLDKAVIDGGNLEKYFGELKKYKIK
jgi:hypothetical protein